MKKGLLILFSSLLASCGDHKSSVANGKSGDGGQTSVQQSLEDKLYTASWRGTDEDMALLEENLSDEFDVNYQFPKEKLNTLIISAAQADQVGIVKLLLNYNPDLTLTNEDQKSAVDVAVSDAVRKLLSGDTDNLNEELILAGSEGDKGTFSELLEAGADINAIDDLGRTSLIYASINGHASIVKIVIKQKGDLNIKDNDGKSALTHAEENNQKRIIKFLKKFGAE